MDYDYEGVLVDLSKIVPAMTDYNLVTIPMEAWKSHERQFKAMDTAARVSKLRRCKKLVRECLNAIRKTMCPTARVVYYLCFKRFVVTTAIVAFSMLRNNDPKSWPVRKIVTKEGQTALNKFLMHKKKRWASVDGKKGSIHLYSNESVFFNVRPCKCHLDAFTKHIHPNLSLTFGK